MSDTLNGWEIMRRYTALVSLWFIKALEYRAELVIWAVLTLLNTTILLAIWLSVFRGVSSLQGYQVGQVLQYFLLATVINGITASHFESWRSREVREGKIDHYLTKPIPYPLQVLLADIGNRSFYVLLIVPITLLVYLAFSFHYSLDVLTLSPLILFQCVLLLGVGYLIEFSFAMIAVLLSFWFEGAEGLEHFKWISISLLSGFMIPLEFMPLWMRSLVNLLPLKYMYAVPIQVVQQRTSLGISDLLYIGGFLLLLFALQRWLWHRATLKYTSAG